MQLEEKPVTLRILTAGEGKVLVSKAKDEEGNPVVKAKKLYLAEGDNPENYEEITEEE